jgi:uncharacterized damage-inducible protein DinB
MHSLIPDLLDHQAWADAEHWRAMNAYPPAQDDPALRNRLHHLHLVQRAFTWAVENRRTPFEGSKPEDFPRFAELMAFARDAHAGMDRIRAGLTEGRLIEKVAIPWFKDPPLTLTVGEALAQCAMHSQWHRGQNATRLRELGGSPPTVDLIVWYWKGRPAPAWD